MPGKERCYWDSDVFLAFVNGEQERVPDITALLAEADRGTLEIVTSTFSVAEVAFATEEKTDGTLDQEAEHRIDSLWRPPSPVRMAEFHIGIAEQARSLMRRGIQHGWGLKPGDAIHLATAVDLAVDVLHTYNLSDFARWSGVLNLRVEKPLAAQPELPTADE